MTTVFVFQSEEGAGLHVAEGAHVVRLRVGDTEHGGQQGGSGLPARQPQGRAEIGSQSENTQEGHHIPGRKKSIRIIGCRRFYRL